jgi:hypothetical protein
MHPLHFTISYGLLLGFLPVVVHGFRYYGNYQRGNISVDSKIIRLKVNDIAFINNTPPGAKHWVSLWV